MSPLRTRAAIFRPPSRPRAEWIYDHRSSVTAYTWLRIASIGTNAGLYRKNCVFLAQNSRYQNQPVPWQTFAVQARRSVLTWGPALAVLIVSVMPACGPTVPGFGSDASDDTSSGTAGSASGASTSTATSGTSSGGPMGTASSGVDTGGSETSTSGPPADVNDATTGDGCEVDGSCGQLDILFVVDNSETMGEEQGKVAREFPGLVAALESVVSPGGAPLDIQIMFTTTDFGNPLCTPYEQHPPEKGAPISTGCNARIDRFTGLGLPPIVVEDACTAGCPSDVVPSESFIHLWGPDPAQNNVPDVPPIDVDGDGQPDGEVEQALACLGPQGVDGCYFESPLESMQAALDPDADWNRGPAPFLRPDSMVAVVIVSDELDCSVNDFSIMSDPTYQEFDPYAYMMKAPSSAICWNAGVACSGPDAQGLYTGCTSTDDGNMMPTPRYVSRLVDELRDTEGREVMMLGIWGVPRVTAHASRPPYQPTAGGRTDLVYRDWVDGEYPSGDLFPEEIGTGVTVELMNFGFGIGPGCTGVDRNGGLTGRGMPPVRMLEVCDALNYTGASGTDRIRCCVESICDHDFGPAFRCLAGMVEDALAP